FVVPRVGEALRLRRTSGLLALLPSLRTDPRLFLLQNLKRHRNSTFFRFGTGSGTASTYYISTSRLRRLCSANIPFVSQIGRLQRLKIESWNPFNACFGPFSAFSWTV